MVAELSQLLEEAEQVSLEHRQQQEAKPKAVSEVVAMENEAAKPAVSITSTQVGACQECVHLSVLSFSTMNMCSYGMVPLNLWDQDDFCCIKAVLPLEVNVMTALFRPMLVMHCYATI